MLNDKSEKEPDCHTLTEKEIDAALKETFPASDPPPWTLGIENQCEEPKEPIDDESMNVERLS